MFELFAARRGLYRAGSIIASLATCAHRQYTLSNLKSLAIYIEVIRFDNAVCETMAKHNTALRANIGANYPSPLFIRVNMASSLVYIALALLSGE